MTRTSIRLFVAMMLMTFGIVLAPHANPVYADGLNISKSSSDDVVEAGQEFDYRILISCSSTTGDCADAVVTDVLPPELSGAATDVFIPPLVGVTSTYDQATRTVTWTFEDDLGGGDIGLTTGSTVELLVTVKFPAGSTPDGTVATNTATFAADTDDDDIIETVDSNPQPVEATASFAFNSIKSVRGGVANIGIPVTYDIELCSDPTGGLDMEAGATLRDTLPAGAQFISAAGGGAETSPGVVEWTLPAVPADGNCHVVGSVTVLFDSPPFVENQVVTNVASVLDPVPLGGDPGSPEPPIDASLDHPLVLPTAVGGAGKEGAEWITPGQPYDYTLSIDSTAFLPITDAVLVDTIPPQVDVTSITIPAGIDRAFYTSDLDGSLRAIPGFVGSPLTVAKADLVGAGDYVASIQFEADSVGAFQTIEITVGAEVIDGGPPNLDRDGDPIVEGAIQGDGTTVTNCTSLTYVDHEGFSQSPAAACNSIATKQEFAVPRIIKSGDSGPYLPGATVTWEIEAFNDDAASMVVEDFVIRDLIPDEYDDGTPVSITYVPLSARVVSKPSGAPDPVISDTTTDAASGRPLLEWRWTAADGTGYDLAPGESVTVAFEVTLGDPIPPATITNHAGLSGWQNGPSNSDPDRRLIWNCDPPSTLDADLVATYPPTVPPWNDPEAINPPCFSSSPITIQAITGLDSIKWVRGEADVDEVIGAGGDPDAVDPEAAGYTRFPETGFTYQGGYVDYRIRLTNPGNVPIDDLVVLDILPFVGDSGVLTGARGTEWRPILVDPVVVPNATVFYSIEEDPCRNDRLKIPTGCTDWTATPPDPINDTQALLIDFDDAFSIPAAGELQVELNLTAPAGTPVDGAIAWNSFAFSSARADTGGLLLPAEPRKVGIVVRSAPSAVYGDYVWFDFDHDGIQDPEETGPELVDQPMRPTGINGVRVQFYQDLGPGDDPATPDGISANDVFIRQTFTEDDFAGNPGFYSFPELTAGTYYAVFDVPAGYELTLPDEGTDIALDSDADFSTHTFEGSTIADTGSTVTTQVVVPPTLLSQDEVDLTWDVGFWDSTRLRSSLGDLAWYDNNTTGLQDGAPDGVENVTVNLWWVGEDGTKNDGAGDDILLQTETTDTNGLYRFDWLVPGPNYYVEFVQPTGFLFSEQDVGVLDTDDSDVDPATGFTSLIDLDNGPDPDAVVWDPDTETVEPQWDAGIFVPNTIGDFVWEDLDRDGVQDAAEPGIDGVTVRLYSPGLDGLIGGTDDVELDTTTTAGGGRYDFDDRPNGDYFIVVDPPSGYLTSPTDVPGDDAVDSDGTTDAAYPGQIVMSSVTNLQIEPGIDGTLNTADDAGENDPTWDFGFYRLATIGDFVWEDLDRDGIQDAGEPGVNGVTVTLTGGNLPPLGLTMTTTNDPSGGAPGWYEFTGLQPGTYSLEFDPSTAPTTVDRPWFFSPTGAGTSATDSDANPLDGTTTATVLVSNENDPTWDAGIWRWAKLGDYVWHDIDGDGIQDASEPGLNGVDVELLDAGGTVVASTTTADNPTGGAPGWYEFDDLEPDTYSVRFVLGSTVLTTGGFVATFPDETTDTNDSDADRTNGETIQTQLTSNEDDPTWDAGFYIPVNLGDYVWYDSDVDGVQDAADGDPTTGIRGVNGVTVRLTGGDLPSAGLTTTTANNPTGGEPGWYEFADLRPGNYEVEFVLPTGFAFSPQGVGADTTDSDADQTTGRTGSITLTSGNDDVTWDAGIYQFAGLGDFVWEDDDADGIQDPGETGINGVIVTLTGGNLPPGGISTTTANDPVGGAPGWYEFDGLVPGTYTVTFDQSSAALAGFDPSPQDQLSDDAVDSDADPTTGQVTTTLSLNEFDPTIDAGFYRPASLGDFVWNDLDGDGVQDAGEPGINGVDVDLLDASGAVIASTATANDPVGGAPGWYEFADLVPGTYSVRFDVTSTVLVDGGFVLTPANVGSDTTDSDAAADGRTAITTLTSGQNDPTLDAGFYAPVAVGDFVWEDLDGNGFFDALEPGINGVDVDLLNSSGTVVASTTTANNPTGGAPGWYEFAGLAPGSYSVRFDLTTVPIGMVPTIQDADGDVTDDTDSDADSTTGATAPTAFLQSGQEDRTLDMGLVVPVAVGDLVWHDQDGDGVQDAGEPGIGGVDVELFYIDPAGGPDQSVGTTTTSVGSGSWLFSGLNPGQYYAVFDLSTLPADYVATFQNVGDDAADSDGDPTTGITANSAFLASGGSDPTHDLGIYRPVSVGDRVWDDLDGDGVQDAGELGVPGVRVYLLDAAGARVTDGAGAHVFDTTDGSGLYLFEDLPPGAYAVEFDLSTLPADYVVTFQNVGDDAADSDGDPTTGITAATPFLQSGSAANLSLDLGIFEPVSVGDFVFEDVDGDGVQDGGEPGVEDVDVALFRVDPAGGAPIASGTTSTDIDGLYLFQNLQPGEYFVVFDLDTLPTGFVATFQNVGDDVLDSDADRLGGQTAPTPFLTSGSAPDLSLDLGVFDPVTVGDVAWDDLNGDGIQDPGEPGVEGVDVTLFDVGTDGLPGTLDDVEIGTETTDTNGAYLFIGLDPGEYYVVFDVTTLPGGYVTTFQDRGGDDTLDSDADPASGVTRTTGFLDSQADDLDLDVGLYIPVRVGDVVWFDQSGNGLQDGAEPGVADVDVTLFAVGPDGDAGTADDVEINTTTTGTDGSYLFDGLPPDDYYVVFDLTTIPADHVATLRDVGVDDAIDSDADRVTGATTSTGLIPSGNEDLTLDLGIVVPVTIGDRVWIDQDADGIQDADEVGAAGVTVVLWQAGPDGVPGTADDVQIDRTVTSATGDYLFPGVDPGEYFVQFDLDTLPIGHVATLPNEGGDETTDSDGDPTTGITRSTGFLDGSGVDTNDLDLDLGIYVPARVGDVVWEDRNGDGVQDAGEPGQPGITIRLIDAGADGELGTADDVVVDSTVTDADGSYEFVGVRPGDYGIEVDPSTLPTGAVLSPMGVDCTGTPVGSSCADDSDVDPATGRSDVIVLDFGEDDPDWDVGFVVPFDLTLSKTAEGSFEVGLPGTFLLVVSNTGPGTAYSPLEVVDELPVGLVYRSSSGPGWSCDSASQTVTCVFSDDLLAGTSVELRITVDVTAAASSGFVNTASVRSLSAPDVESGVGNNAGSTDTVAVTTPATQLPRTGGGAGVPLRVAGMLVALGVLFWGVSRRRRTATS
jgi:fimbrial isopeptide formation D2 family protein